MFRKSIALARRTCDDVAILSAKYGLVLLNQRIEPYEKTLSTMSKAERAAWALRVCGQLERTFPYHSIIYYTGTLYCEGLPPGSQPMAGMPLGYRLQWLSQQLLTE